ncbi:MAG: AsmA family protein [Bacteroidota bacterium]|nr:AsmA family protein [Bacteroidota bacterium]
MKFVKRIIGILFLLVCIVIGTVFVTVTFYKKELTNLLISGLKDNYGLTLKSESIRVSLFANWPNTSLQFRNIIVANDLQPNEILLQAESLSLSFNIEKLFHKEFIVNSISIKHGNINLVKGVDGIKNYEFVRKDSVLDSQSSILFELKRVNISETNFCFFNKRYRKKIDFLLKDNEIKFENFADGMDAHLTGQVLIKGLLFREEKGAFLSNTPADLNLKARICFPRKEIFIHEPSYAEIGKHRYALSAFVELKDRKHLTLSIANPIANYLDVISLLNPGVKKGLSKIKVKKPVDARALIMVEIGEQQDPIVIIHASSSKNNVEIGTSGVPYTNIAFQASVISLHPSLKMGDGDHAKVILKPLSGKIYDFGFNGALTVHNFTDPFIVVNAQLDVDAKKIKLKPSQALDLKGMANIRLNYRGPVNKLNDEEFLDKPMSLKAKIKFSDVCYQEKGKPYLYCVSGNASVNNNLLKFDNLALKTDGGDFTLKGSVNNFVKYTLGFANGFKASLNASSNYFDVTGYLKKSVKGREVEENDTTKNKMQNFLSDESKFEFDVSMAVKKLVIRKVEASNASISLYYKDKLLDIKSLNAKTCKGSVSATGSIYDLKKIKASIQTESISVNQMFEEFENFGQKAIEGKNLSGNISLSANVKMELNDNMEVDGNTIKGKIDFKIRDGRLINYEPLQNISNFIFKNRDFEDISFTELHETLIVDGFKMDIKEMEIASSVLNLYMSGIYHFKDNSNINILLPWSNLKKRSKNYLPKNSGKSQEDSKGLKLNYSGYPGKLKLGLGHKTL